MTRSALFFFLINHLQDIEFLDSSNQSTLVSDLNHRAIDTVFFTFRSTVTASDVDHHFSSTTLLLDSPLFKNTCHLHLPCHLAIDEFVKHALFLVLESSLETNIASICKGDAPERPLVSRLATNAAFILRNNATTLKLASSLAN